ncbi:MAG: NADH-quinone oxidoreductase subunit F, partial [Deltaproteobacteria bacterium]|nr:NADH-quinone oxidoreductase subunit F [Deltaproteobacteria bacterium]
DIELLSEVVEIVQGRTFCPLGDSAAGLVSGMIRHFRNEFEEHIKNRKCSV